MAQVRWTATVTAEDGVRRLAKRPRKRKDAAPEIDEVRVHPLVMEAARRLANGDPRRIILNHDGTVKVVNRPARARRPQISTESDEHPLPGRVSTGKQKRSPLRRFFRRGLLMHLEGIISSYLLLRQ